MSNGLRRIDRARPERAAAAQADREHDAEGEKDAERVRVAEGLVQMRALIAVERRRRENVRGQRIGRNGGHTRERTEEKLR